VQTGAAGRVERSACPILDEDPESLTRTPSSEEGRPLDGNVVPDGRRTSRPRPVVGITAGVELASWRAWEAAAAVVPVRYVEAVERAGGRAVLLPPSEEGVEETLASIDGLLCTGGPDLGPALYGAEPHPQTTGVRPERDRGELALLRAALRLGLPVLGICRGMELLDVACGGTLHQHLPEVVGHDRHRGGTAAYSRHPVTLAAGSRTRELLDPSVTVPSYHHQGIATVGTGLRAVGWAEDGSVEAIEADGPGFTLGVLWHPEQGDDPRLFAALVEAALPGCRSRLDRAKRDGDPHLAYWAVT
jgi:putative glutamine amidotransferase